MSRQTEILLTAADPLGELSIPTATARGVATRLRSIRQLAKLIRRSSSGSSPESLDAIAAGIEQLAETAQSILESEATALSGPPLGSN